jgi:hypothetical protein
VTVTTALNKIIYAGNGATTVFPFTFPYGATNGSQIQVFFTDTLGNVTLLSPINYTLSLNPASGTNPTGAGGSVTYNPLGVPIPTGTFLTILRTLPLTQATSLANQGTLYQPVEEAALDYNMMTIQQVQELQGRSLAVAVSDPAPGNLPAVAQRANLFLAFDSSGNPIAANPGGATSPVSSAMAPVVAAASLAAGRAAFGLGNTAVLNIGTGLQNDGSGNLQVTAMAAADSTNQTINLTHHMHHHFATGAITYSFGAANTFFNGFQWSVSALTAAVTLSINAADKFSGGATGVSMIIPPGTQATINTDAGTPGTWFISWVNAPGLTTLENVQLNASVGSNALTIALKDRNGNDPSTASPIALAFRDPTATGGDPIIRAITTALSITVPSTATLGTVNAQPARIWVGLFDNAGTPVLGVYNSLNSSGPSIVSWDETSPATGTAIVGGSNSSQTWYTNGTVTSKSFRILGYIEATETVAGTWATAPSKIQLFGVGIKRPGDVISSTSTTTNIGGTTTSATYAALTTGLTLAINVNSACNLVYANAVGPLNVSVAAAGKIKLSRGTVANTNLFGCVAAFNIASAGTTPSSIQGYDIPGVTGSVTYAVQGQITSGILTFPNSPGVDVAYMELKEIQI